MFAFAAGKIIRAAIFTAISAAPFPQPIICRINLKGSSQELPFIVENYWFFSARDTDCYAISLSF